MSEALRTIRQGAKQARREAEAWPKVGFRAAERHRAVADWLACTADFIEVRGWVPTVRNACALSVARAYLGAASDVRCAQSFYSHESGWSVPRFCHRPEGHKGEHCGPGPGNAHIGRCQDAL